MNAYEYRDGWLYYTQHHHKSRIGTRVGGKGPGGYWVYNNRYIHILIWEMHNGPRPPGMLVDHADRNIDNCAIGNLRLVNASQSSANRSSKRRDCPKGVRPYKGKFRAYLDGKHLGTFATMEMAAAVRSAHETIYHKDPPLKS